MALRFIDSGQHVANAADMDQKYDRTSGVLISTAVSRPHNAQSIHVSQNEELVKTLDAQATWIVGCAFRTDSLAANQLIINLKDTHSLSSTTGQLAVRVETDGKVAVLRGGLSGTALASSSAGVIAVDTWYYVELKATINNSGSFDLQIDGSSVISGSAVDTQDTGNATATHIALGNSGSGAINHYFSDIYINDGTGGVDDDFFGPAKSEVIMPGGAGNYTEWAGSPGANYANVDDPASIDDDTTFNFETVAAQKDSFAYANVALTGTVFGVAVNISVRMDDAGPHTIRPIARIGGTDYFGSTVAVTGAYQIIQYIWRLDPDTGAAWTNSGLDAAEFGYELVS